MLVESERVMNLAMAIASIAAATSATHTLAFQPILVVKECGNFSDLHAVPMSEQRGLVMRSSLTIWWRPSHSSCCLWPC